MKKIIVLLAVIFFGLTLPAMAQDTSKAKKAELAVKKGAKKVGNKTAEVASKGKSRVTDKVYKGKVAPGGETVYIDDHSRYYWVDKKGHRQYVTEAELKNKPVEVKVKAKH